MGSVLAAWGTEHGAEQEKMIGRSGALHMVIFQIAVQEGWKAWKELSGLGASTFGANTEANIHAEIRKH